LNIIKTDLDKPILFRTVDPNVYRPTLDTGSIWLRTSRYYRAIEDKARSDIGEGVNSSSMKLPLNFKSRTGANVNLLSDGMGKVGTEIIDHYLVSLHGISISESARNEFGGCTMGVVNLDKLAAEILYECSKQIDVKGYRYGPVHYQNTALVRSQHSNSAVINIGSDTVPEFVKTLPTDVLRKEPVEPFISQDEWRIVIFSNTFISNDFNEPLKINVSPEHFYEYIA